MVRSFETSPEPASVYREAPSAESLQKNDQAFALAVGDRAPALLAHARSPRISAEREGRSARRVRAGQAANGVARLAAAGAARCSGARAARAARTAWRCNHPRRSLSPRTRSAASARAVSIRIGTGDSGCVRESAKSRPLSPASSHRDTRQSNSRLDSLMRASRASRAGGDAVAVLGQEARQQIAQPTIVVHD
jgi:hypothetical protein